MTDAVDFKYYQYEADDSSTWSIKQNETWGDDADAGFGPADATDPVMVKSPSLFPRTIQLQDPVSGRVTTRVVGSPSAAAWTTAGFTTTVTYPGLASPVVVTKFAQRGERIRRARTIINKPEPS